MGGRGKTSEEHKERSPKRGTGEMGVRGGGVVEVQGGARGGGVVWKGTRRPCTQSPAVERGPPHAKKVWMDFVGRAVGRFPEEALGSAVPAKRTRNQTDKTERSTIMKVLGSKVSLVLVWSSTA